MMKAKNKSIELLWSIFRYILIIGISFVIIYPLLQQISVAIKDKADIYNPTIYMIPVHFTTENIRLAMSVLNYWPLLKNTLLFVCSTTVLQAVSCALAGYGFARFTFPGRNILFTLVILTILIPSSTLMVPMYLHFRNFDVLGMVNLFTGKEGINMLNTYWPSLITAALANGLKSGLYIYIFRQFFRGMPAEIEEAALIDGAGGFRTFFTIMMPNAIPPLITVTLFAFVWQYNDTFYSSLFMSQSNLMAIKIASLPADANQYLPGILGVGAGSNVKVDPNLVSMIVDTGILLAIAPLVVMYLFVQRFFVESVERTGVVG
ncbi:carbohydrate ABC transporter permease [Paenibacillus montanisoli]|uniref:Carbohydrate ABC transporter permease n=2 Tax=Paenibacillus montanisoli TaxID=2081970 RepID=A0A328U2J8_9BACL|nr:carbohydrate ABC transporter permease [Paenibacillus montanisoli]RAP76869.1 carbohydrate ABC transporter permease [Paenibacillus montanisoli]